MHGAKRFLGELSMITGQRIYLSGVVRDGGEVIQVPLAKLREIVAEDKSFSDLILGAFIARRSILIEVASSQRNHRFAEFGQVWEGKPAWQVPQAVTPPPPGLTPVGVRSSEPSPSAWS